MSQYLLSSYLDEIKERDPKPFYKPTCAMLSEDFSNCPEKIKWAVNINDEEAFLCEKCYKNVKFMIERAEKGTPWSRMKILAAINIADLREM